MVETALFFQVLIWLLITAIFFRSSRPSIFHPIAFYLVFHGIVFVLRPLLVYYANFDFVWHYIGFDPTNEQFIRALAISSAGLVTFVISCHFGAKKSRKLIFSGSKIVFTEKENLAFYILLAFFLPVIIYSFEVMTGGIGGERVGETFIMTDVSGYAYQAQDLIIPLLTLLLVKNRFKAFTLIPVIAYFGYRAFIGWGRWAIILSSICFLLAYCWSQRRIRLPVFVFIIAPVLFISFSIIGSNRDIFKQYLTGQTPETTILDKSLTWQEKYDNLDFASFDFLTYIAAMVPKETGTYNYGIGWLQLFTEPIPRQLWPGKPIGAPSFFVLSTYGNFIGLTDSLPGSGWMDGGWFGVVIISSLWGFGLGRFYKWFTWNERSKVSALIYIMAISMIVQLFRDGNISIFKFWLFTVPPFFLWHIIAKILDSKLPHNERVVKP